MILKTFEPGSSSGFLQYNYGFKLLISTLYVVPNLFINCCFYRIFKYSNKIVIYPFSWFPWLLFSITKVFSIQLRAHTSPYKFARLMS